MTEPVVRLDRSKTFSENRGEMTPEDPFYRVRYMQGGTLIDNGKRHTVLLPFDSNGDLVPDDRKGPYKGRDAEGKEVTFKPLWNDRMRKYLQAKLKRASQTAMQPSEPTIDDGAPGEEIDPLGPAIEGEDVNLVAWLKGEASHEPHEIRTAVRKRYGRTHGRISDLVVDLVFDEHLVPEAEVCAELRQHLESYEKARANAA